MATRPPSLNWLRVFEAAARTESFARAAAQLHMSPAAVSQQIKALETQLGTPLFQRHARGMRLLPAGERFLRHARNVLDEVERARRSVSGRAAPPDATAGPCARGSKTPA